MNNLYMNHTQLHTKACVFTAPDAHNCIAYTHTMQTCITQLYACIALHRKFTAGRERI